MFTLAGRGLSGIFNVQFSIPIATKVFQQLGKLHIVHMSSAICNHFSREGVGINCATVIEWEFSMIISFKQTTNIFSCG